MSVVDSFTNSCIKYATGQTVRKKPSCARQLPFRTGQCP
jgi:hypothetical protein